VCDAQNLQFTLQSCRFIEPDEGQSTTQISQEQIVNCVDITSATKVGESVHCRITFTALRFVARVYCTVPYRIHTQRPSFAFRRTARTRCRRRLANQTVTYGVQLRSDGPGCQVRDIASDAHACAQLVAHRNHVGSGAERVHIHLRQSRY
jgi:hypothetical protein